MVTINASKAIKLTPMAAPTGAAGVMYYDSTANKVKYHNGSSFLDAGSPFSNTVNTATPINTEFPSQMVATGTTGGATDYKKKVVHSAAGLYYGFQSGLNVTGGGTGGHSFCAPITTATSASYFSTHYSSVAWVKDATDGNVAAVKTFNPTGTTQTTLQSVLYSPTRLLETTHMTSTVRYYQDASAITPSDLTNPDTNFPTWRSAWSGAWTNLFDLNNTTYISISATTLVATVMICKIAINSTGMALTGDWFRVVSLARNWYSTTGVRDIFFYVYDFNTSSWEGITGAEDTDARGDRICGVDKAMANYISGNNNMYFAVQFNRVSGVTTTHYWNELYLLKGCTQPQN